MVIIMKKMTNVEFKAMVLSVVEGMEFTAELTQEMFVAKLETLTKAKAPSKKLLAEKAQVLENLVSVLSSETPMNSQEIADALETTLGEKFTAQKITANMKILIEQEQVEKIEPSKRGEKVTYKLA